MRRHPCEPTNGSPDLRVVPLGGFQLSRHRLIGSVGPVNTHSSRWRFPGWDFSALLSMRGIGFLWVGWILLGCVVSAQVPSQSGAEAPYMPIRPEWRAWNARVEPFQIVPHVYYVGAAGVSSFLITSSQGHILLDTGFDATVPLIRESIQKLGFKLSEIRWILSSHAHLDHVGGHARMRAWTGAKIAISARDAELLKSGGVEDFLPNAKTTMNYPPAVADRILKDGDEVRLGDITMICHLTPGHTRGCTTWTQEVGNSEERKHVLYFGSLTVLPETALVGNPRYPQIISDLESSYALLRKLPCDVFLAPHGGFFNLAEKHEKLKQHPSLNPFVDSNEFRLYLDSAEKTFRERLAQERSKTKAL